jgi:hypothetical protein
MSFGNLRESNSTGVTPQAELPPLPRDSSNIIAAHQSARGLTSSIPATPQAQPLSLPATDSGLRYSKEKKGLRKLTIPKRGVESKKSFKPGQSTPVGEFSPEVYRTFSAELEPNVPEAHRATPTICKSDNELKEESIWGPASSHGSEFPRNPLDMRSVVSSRPSGPAAPESEWETEADYPLSQDEEHSFGHSQYKQTSESLADNSSHGDLESSVDQSSSRSYLHPPPLSTRHRHPFMNTPPNRFQPPVNRAFVETRQGFGEYNKGLRSDPSLPAGFERYEIPENAFQARAADKHQQTRERKDKQADSRGYRHRDDLDVTEHSGLSPTTSETSQITLFPGPGQQRGNPYAQHATSATNRPHVQRSYPLPHALISYGSEEYPPISPYGSVQGRDDDRSDTQEPLLGTSTAASGSASKPPRTRKPVDHRDYGYSLEETWRYLRDNSVGMTPSHQQRKQTQSPDLSSTTASVAYGQSAYGSESRLLLRQTPTPSAVGRRDLISPSPLHNPLNSSRFVTETPRGKQSMFEPQQLRGLASKHALRFDDLSANGSQSPPHHQASKNASSSRRRKEKNVATSTPSARHTDHRHFRQSANPPRQRGTSTRSPQQTAPTTASRRQAHSPRRQTLNIQDAEAFASWARLSYHQPGNTRGRCAFETRASAGDDYSSLYSVDLEMQRPTSVTALPEVPARGCAIEHLLPQDMMKRIQQSRSSCLVGWICTVTCVLALVAVIVIVFVTGKFR